MITLILEYPFNTDIFYYGLPVPENVSTNELCLLNFKSLEEYSNYLNVICDIIDVLEYSAFFNYNTENAEKLIFSKRFVQILLEVKIDTVHTRK